MLLSDSEIKRWWESLTKHDQLEVLAKMVAKMEHKAFAKDLARQYVMGDAFTPRQLAVIYKWGEK